MPAWSGTALWRTGGRGNEPYLLRFHWKAFRRVRVCRTWCVSRLTVYWRRQPSCLKPRRRGPQSFHTDVELVDEIKGVLTESPFTGEGYRKVWAMLRDKYIRTSKERTLRLMRQNGLLAHNRPDRPHGPKVHNDTIRTQRVDEMWGSDMITAMTLYEGNASIFFAIDHCSLELVGIHAAKRGARLEALEPIRQGVRHNFGALARMWRPG